LSWAKALVVWAVGKALETLGIKEVNWVMESRMIVTIEPQTLYRGVRKLEGLSARVLRNPIVKPGILSDILGLETDLAVL
jgi:hypothetical protein